MSIQIIGNFIFYLFFYFSTWTCLNKNKNINNDRIFMGLIIGNLFKDLIYQNDKLNP